MVSPERFSNLPEYAFPRLRALLDGDPPGGDVVAMSIGEPRHPFPPMVRDAISANADGFNRYPPNNGTPELQAAQASWVKRRYGAELSPASQIMALNGTREGLFSAVVALCPELKAGRKPVVLIPNPFYQVYMVAALAIGAEPVFVPATADTGFLPDYAGLATEILDRTAIAFLCSPSNPQGAVASSQYWAGLLALAEKHDFRVFADECYSEIYRNTPPAGVLQVAAAQGADPERALAFHSLSKRSNLSGLRSGFVAGGPNALRQMKLLRAYAGAPLPLPLQRAAERVWADEAHVVENRALYQAKYTLADQVFAGVPGYAGPEGGFFLWLPVDDGATAALKIWRETGVRVLPGAYLAQTVRGANPGAGYIRVAMVAPADELESGLKKLRASIYE